MYKLEKSLLIEQRELSGQISPRAVLAYCQEIALVHAKAIGVDTASLGGTMSWILGRMTVEYSGLITTKDSVIIKTYPCVGKGIVYPRQYIIESVDGEQILRATSDWLILDIDKRQIVRAGSLNGYQEHCLEADKELMAYPKERARDISCQQLLYSYTVRRSCIDEVGHMNNTCYAEIMYDAISQELCNRGIKSFNITFVSEAREGETLDIYRIAESDGEVVQGIKSDGKVSFVIKVIPQQMK